MTHAATPLQATDETFQLAEGPVWDVGSNRLIWVDIMAGAVLEGSLDGLDIRVTKRHGFEGMVGAAVVTEDGSLLVAAREHLVLIEPDGMRRDGPRIVPIDSGRRLNDGAVDPAGRFVVGTLALDGDSRTETLIRLEADGHITEIDHDLTLSNGLGWSCDGRRFFTVDTLTGNVFVREYDPENGDFGHRSVHIHITDGSPDGIAVDAEDHLWIAIWGRGEVRRYSPDGRVVDRIEVPAPHSTSVALVGDDLRTLVITTAFGELAEGDRDRYPASGHLFTVRTEVPGVPTPRWRRTHGFV